LIVCTLIMINIILLNFKKIKIMITGMYIFFSLMIVFGAIGLIASIYKITQQEKSDILDEMWKNGDISDVTYKKYKF